MLHPHPINRAIGLFILFLAFAVLLTGCTGSSSGTSASATLQPDGSSIAKGKVAEVSATTVTVKPPKGEAVQVQLTTDTRYNGVTAGQIKKGQALEIRYRTEGAENIAIQVNAIKEGSC